MPEEKLQTTTLWKHRGSIFRGAATGLQGGILKNAPGVSPFDLILRCFLNRLHVVFNSVLWCFHVVRDLEEIFSQVLECDHRKKVLRFWNLHRIEEQPLHILICRVMGVATSSFSGTTLNKADKLSAAHRNTKGLTVVYTPVKFDRYVRFSAQNFYPYYLFYLAIRFIKCIDIICFS